MKINLGILSAGAAWLFTMPARADQAVSPDGRFKVKTNLSIEVVDASGTPVILLDKNAEAMKRVEVAWSADSQRMVVAEDIGRGSSILAAWRDGAAWHKAFQLDADREAIVRALQRHGAGRLVADQRSLGQWVSPEALTVKGQLTFSNGRRVAYAYTLKFASAPAPVQLDRGGYEEGAIKGTDYHITRQ